MDSEKNLGFSFGFGHHNHPTQQQHVPTTTMSWYSASMSYVLLLGVSSKEMHKVCMQLICQSMYMYLDDSYSDTVVMLGWTMIHV